MTQEELGEAIGTSGATISRIESGKQPYTQDVLEALAAALDCKPADLLERHPSDPLVEIVSIASQAQPAQKIQILEVAKTLLRTSG